MSVLVRQSPSGPEVPVIEGALLRLTRYTTAAGAQTHVCLDEATHVYVQGGAGGGAAGGANAGVGQASVGGGASAGGAFEDFFALDQGQTISFNVGAGGIPTQGGTGGDGNNTTVAYGNRAYTCNKGLGSFASAQFAQSDPLILGCVDGGTATATIGGVSANSSNAPNLVLIKGGPGTMACRETTTSGVGGNGGASAMAPGGTGASAPRTSNASANGSAGQLGSGGGGAVNFNDNPAAGNTGGAGGTGYFFVWEILVDA